MRNQHRNMVMLSVGFLLTGFIARGQSQDVVLSSYSNQTEISATRSITLKSGFYIPSGKTVRLFIDRNPSLVTMPGLPNGTQNYVMKTTYLLPVGAEANATMASQKMQDVSYYDGLGRPVQTVAVKASPTFGDIVSHQSYDAFGREERSYLPYMSGEDGNYKANAVTAQAAFYNSGSNNGVTTIAAVSGITPSFSRPVYEASPLSRVLEQGFPGQVWQPAAARSAATGRTVAMEYTVNNTTPFGTLATTRQATLYGVGYDQYGDPVLQQKGVYGAKELRVTVTKDENWISTNGRLSTTEEYTDKQGRMVLKRTFNKNAANVTEMLSTYYVYDDFGNLCYVLPPGLLPDRVAGSTPIALADLNKLAYQYRWDKRNRLSQKRLPGRVWENMVYNSQGLVVMHQDGRKGANGTYYHTFYKYDGLGRVAIKGTESNRVSAHWEAQNAVDAQVYPNHWEERSLATGHLHGYTNRSVPADVQYFTVMEVNYYDDYTEIPSLPNNESAQYSKLVHGQLTAKKVRVIGAATETWLWTVYYYDAKGRVAKEWSQHYKGATVSGNTNTVEYTYNFAGQPTQTVQKLVTANALALTVTTKYSYDHRGRLLDTKKQVKNAADAAGPEVLVARNEYNEIGQLRGKGLHGKSGGGYVENIAYSYNPRGWLTVGGSDLFNQVLHYNDAPTGVAAQFNGNISGQEWSRNKVATGSYGYSYDNLNRLINGTAGNGKKELLEYDVMGNIKGLTRDVGAKWLYEYDGNKLSTIKFGTTTYTYTHEAESGNVTRDGRNANTIAYNYLNLPEKITGTRAVTYAYSGNGEKLRAVNAGIVRDYVKGTEWTAQGLDLVHMEEGRITKNGAAFNYEYVLKDHLGNARAGFRVNSNGTVEANLLRDYYPFGMEHADATAVTPSPKNNYLYNGKELQDGLGQYDYGARFYDPVIGRWGSMDPNAEKYITLSPYNYAVNNPVKYIDPDGRDFILSITRDKEGNITNVNVSATVYITGEGASERRANELNDFSSSFFKQQNKSNVSFNINYVYRKNANKNSLKQGENILTFNADTEKGENHRSSVVGVVAGNRHFTGRTGNIYGKGGSNFTVLHESLHLIGLSDRYQDKENSFTKKWYSEPHEGFEKDVMGYHGGKSFDVNYGKYYFDAAKFYSDRYGKDRIPLRRMVDMDGHLLKTPYEEDGYHLNVPTDKN